MNTLYRGHEIRITRLSDNVFFIVTDPNGVKMTSGFFGLKDSIVEKYRELRIRIDMELSADERKTSASW